MATKKKKTSTKNKTKKVSKARGYTPRQLAIIGVAVLAIIGVAIILMLTSRTPTEQPPTVTITGETLLATANGIEIYREDVQRTQEQLAQQTGQQITEEQALEQTITMKLLVQEAENRGHSATTEDVEELIEAQGMTREELRQLTEIQGMDYDEFIEEQKEQLILQRLVEELSQDIQVNEEEIRNIYEEQVAPTQNVTYEEVRDDIESFVQEQQAIQAIQQLATQLYQTAEIEVHN